MGRAERRIRKGDALSSPWGRPEQQFGGGLASALRDRSWPFPSLNKAVFPSLGKSMRSPRRSEVVGDSRCAADTSASHGALSWYQGIVRRVGRHRRRPYL